MNSVQRAIRSILRKPVRNLLLLGAVSMIGLLILAGMASGDASIAVQDSTRQAIGAGLRLDANETNRTQRLKEISERIGSDTEGSLDGVHQEKVQVNGLTQWYIWTDNAFETLRLEDIETIAAVPGISAYNITTAVTAVNPVNFERIEDPDADPYSDVQGVSLIGSREMALDTNVLSGNVSIYEGRMITAQDTDVCVISKQLAARNGLVVGDILRMNAVRDREHTAVYETKIIGIYQTKQVMPNYMSGDTYRGENIIFTDLRFPEKPQGYAGNPLFEHAYFQIGNVDAYESVKAAIQQLPLDWTRYDLIDRDGNLTAMASNFHDLKQISKNLICFTAAAGFIILFLIFTFWMKNRAREIGILLAVGISKRGILGQILIETLAAVLAALCICVFAAGPVSGAMARYLTTQQAEQSELQQQADAGQIATEYQPPELTVTAVQVRVSTEMFLCCGVGIACLTGTAVLLAGGMILRKKPQEILSNMS